MWFVGVFAWEVYSYQFVIFGSGYSPFYWALFFGVGVFVLLYLRCTEKKE